ncbi:MAG: HIT family protein [Candidatus Woesearchaeota archaeon]
MEKCIFCRIANKGLPSFKIDENEKYITFMDIFPPTFDGKVTMPVVLITTKEHKGSNVFEDLDEDEYNSLLGYTRKVAKAIQKALLCDRVCLVFEGLEIDHIHPKLYPVFSDTYPGYLSTEKSVGNKDIKAPDALLNELAEKISAELR